LEQRVGRLKNSAWLTKTKIRLSICAASVKY
jgi:hypothetical protein